MRRFGQRRLWARLDSRRRGHARLCQGQPSDRPPLRQGRQAGRCAEGHIPQVRAIGLGWTANIPGFGLLADQFTEPSLQHLDLRSRFDDAGAVRARKRACRCKPFPGTIGVAPGAPGLHSVVPPRARRRQPRHSRPHRRASSLYLPVEVEGALFSVGDTHAAQGDGEVCGTAIESPMDVARRSNWSRTQGSVPAVHHARPGHRHLDGKGYEVTTGIGPDLMTGAREAVMRMIDLLATAHGLAPVDAYMLCTVCADLRISEIVDMPNWVVSFYFPRIVFS